MGDLRVGDARKGEWRKLVFSEKASIGGFVAVFSGAAAELAHEEEFVGVESVRWVTLKVPVVKRGKLGDGNVVAGLFPGLAGSGEARRFTGIGPAAGERPAAVFELADQKNAAEVKDGGADIDFGSGVAGL